MLIKIVYSQLLELPVTTTQANQQRFNFPDQAQLRDDNVVIDGFEAYNISDITKSPAGNAVISAAVMQYSYLTMFMIDLTTGVAVGEQLNQIPLVSIHRMQTSTSSPYVRDMFGTQGFKVNWAKSYVTTGQAPGFAATTSFLFNIYYHKTSSPNSLMGKKRTGK